MLRRASAPSSSLWAAAVSPAPRRTHVPRPHRRPLSVAAPALSHVGSAPISLPSTVHLVPPPRPSAAAPASSAPALARLRGPKGELAVDIAPFIRLDLVDTPASSSSSSSSRLVRVAIDDAAVKHQRAVWGLTRSLLANAVVGVSEGYTLPLRLVGVGYRATVEPAPHLGPARLRLNLKLGFAHPVLVDLPPDVAASTPSPTSILLAGIDKQRLGQVAARIRSWRIPEPYNGKGIFVGNEQVRRKEVKKNFLAPMSWQLAYAVLSGLLVLFNSVPLYWQFVQGNSGAIAMGVWVVLTNLIEFVNAVLWYHDDVDRAPVWCDIRVKLAIGQEVGRVAAVFCIARFLADIDYLLSFGVPGVIMACHILYQPNRYRLVRGRGCQVTQVMTWPTLVLRIIWSPLFAVGGTLYSAYTVYRLIRHRRNFGRVVAGAHSALTTARFIRLGAVSMAYLCVGVPLSVWSAIVNIQSSGRYYDYSWTYAHSAWHVRPVTYGDEPAHDFTSWANVIVGLIFFAAFGFGTEAITAYKRICSALRAGTSHVAHGPRSRSRGASFWSRYTGRSTECRSSPSQIPAFEIGRDVGVKEGVKVVIEEEQNIV